MVRKRERERERERGNRASHSLSPTLLLSLSARVDLPTYPLCPPTVRTLSLCNRSELLETKVVVIETFIFYQIDRTMFRDSFSYLSPPNIWPPCPKSAALPSSEAEAAAAAEGRRAETVPQVPSPRQERRIPLFFSFPPHTLHYSAELIIALIYKGKTEEEEIDKKRCFCCYVCGEE